jgi:hypothetical protein
MLKIDPWTEKPALLFFDTCRHIIADLQVIPTDPDGTDDINKKYADDHAYDSLRYGVMTRPRANDAFSFGNLGATITGYKPSDSKFGY